MATADPGLARVPLGVDGCKGGWLVIGWTHPTLTWRMLRLDELHHAFDSGTRTWIDVPIGLPDSTSFRECDFLARRALPKGYASSVFNPPTRASLEAPSYVNASEANAVACGKKLSKQAWFLVPRIRLADRLLRRQPELHDRVFEAHPELSFAQLSGGRSLPKKHTAEGLSERLALLEAQHPNVPATFSEIIGTLRRYEAGQDDVVDAMVLAWGASMMAQGGRWRSLPADAPLDSAGVPQRIVFAG